jgi:microsomal dipeptidase-like Zn-dependent dipeptidase
MHLISDPDEDLTLRHMVNPRHRRRVRDWLRAAVLEVVSRLFNYRSWSSGHRVDASRMHRGGVRLGFSVLYAPLAEFQVAHWNGPPDSEYVGWVEDQLAEVEKAAEREGAVVVRDRPSLEAALAGEQVGLVHCMEGGFQLGATPVEIRRTVERLAGRGLVYVTLAHLFWRQVATNANAFPFFGDRTYHRLFHEPEVGLTDLGRAAVETMVEHRVIVDVAHMSQAAVDETLELIEGLDRGSGVTTPVVATHVATRRDSEPLEYNVTRATVERIADRGGVVGLIMGDHIVAAGVRAESSRRDRRTKDFSDSFEALCEHVDTLRDWCGGSFEHIGIGSDLDGFIKPTLAGIEYADDMGQLEPALAGRYGAASAELIASGNAVRLLRSYRWPS